jgi:NADP-dependent 3-hydroxy acid dehydrogenase YdfG/acyl carrier protein
MLRKKSERMRMTLQEVIALVASGVFVPPPLEEASIENAGAAIRKAAQAQHLGKLVLTTSSPDLRIQVPVREQVAVRKDASYLISGGLGGLGLSVAGWLAAQGAGQLVLLSRSGIKSAEQLAAVDALRAAGTQVVLPEVDVADRAGVESLLSKQSPSWLPLRGVIHAAGVLDDGLLMQQTAERFAYVMRPKVHGAWNLHELTRFRPLDFFVMYSSAAGLLGSPGQGNYAAANTFLDALAQKRRAEGLPGLSIDWGAFSEVGLAADRARGERLAVRGMRSLTPAEGLHVLSGLIGASEAQIGVVPLNLRQWGAFHQVALASPRLLELRRASAAEGPKEGDSELLTRLRSAPPASRAALIAERLRGQVAQVMRVPEGRLELDTPLSSLGLDSLTGLELRNRVETLFGIKVPATLLWTYPTLLALSGQLAKSIAGPGDEPTDMPQSPPEAQKDLVAFANEEALFALLDESLARAESKVRR